MTNINFSGNRPATEKRQENRLAARRPVRLDGGIGVTRNISASGVFFESDTEFVLGAEINFFIELIGLSGDRDEPVLLKCRGEVVRLETIEGKPGVAVRTAISMLDAPADRGTKARLTSKPGNVG